MRTFWGIAFSDLIVILGIIITIGLAVIILWVELTIKRRWDTLFLTRREVRKFLRKIKKQTSRMPAIKPYDGNSYCFVSIITRVGNLAAGRIKTPHKRVSSEGKEQESLPASDTMVMYDFRKAVPLVKAKDETAENETAENETAMTCIIPYSAILAELT